MHICLVYTQTPKPYTFGRFLYALLAWEMCERTFETPCTLDKGNAALHGLVSALHNTNTQPNTAPGDNCLLSAVPIPTVSKISD